MVSNESIVLEEVLRRAMDDALKLQTSDSAYDRGQLFAYFGVLEWGKEQANIMGIEFADKELQAFDPYALLQKSKKAA